MARLRYLDEYANAIKRPKQRRNRSTTRWVRRIGDKSKESCTLWSKWSWFYSYYLIKLLRNIAIFKVFPIKVKKVCNFSVEINTLDTNVHCDIYERFTRGRSWHREIKTNIRNDDISAISKPPGCPWVSTEPEEPIEFDFLGLKCDHQCLKQLEPKNLSKRAKFC